MIIQKKRTSGVCFCVRVSSGNNPSLINTLTTKTACVYLQQVRCGESTLKTVIFTNNFIVPYWL